MIDPVHLELGLGRFALRYHNNLGKNATSLAFMLVAVDIVQGKHVKTGNVLKDIFMPSSRSILYKTFGFCMFDHTDLDEKIYHKILKDINLDRKKAASFKTVADLQDLILLGDKSKQPTDRSEIDDLLEEKIPSEIAWDLEGDSDMSVEDFIQYHVPFYRLRSWLNYELHQVQHTDEDSFFSKISVRSQSVYSLVQ